MAPSIWHTDGELWVPKYQIYFGGEMNTPAYVVFENESLIILYKMGKRQCFIVNFRKSWEDINNANNINNIRYLAWDKF